MEIYHIIPLCNALVYTIAILCIKRATNDGVGPWRTTFFSNAVLFLASSVYWFFGDPIESWTLLWIPAAVGAAFFLGQLLGCLAIHKGDVSLLTPLLGTKTVMVALIVSVAFGQALTQAVWIGALLSAVAVFLMWTGSLSERRRLLPSIYLGLLCSLFYSLTDTLTQGFGGELGFPKLMASSAAFIMLYSLFLIPRFKSPIGSVSKRALTWMIVGAVFLAVQAHGMAYVLSTYGKATVVNVLYSSRGIWSVVLVWFVGHWFSNTERQLGKGIMVRRFAGSVLLIGAIFTVMNG